jgi:hypothetical protein
MSHRGRIIVIAAAVWFVIFTVYYSHRMAWEELFVIPLFYCFLAAGIVSIVCIFSEWRERRWYSVLPFASCVLSLVVAMVLAFSIRDAIRARSFPSYETVVREMELGHIPVSTNWSRIRQAEPQARFVDSVFARRTNGVLTVEFVVERMSLARYTGYLYYSAGVIEPGSYAEWRWPLRREVKPGWYTIFH